MSVFIIPELRKHLVDIDSIQPYPGNPRIGNLPAIMESIEENGVYRACVVQKSTNFVLVGNNQWEAMKELGAEKIPAIFHDYNDKQAKKIATVDNRTQDLAKYDETLYKAWMIGLDPEDLRGSGYDLDAYEDLMAKWGEVTVTEAQAFQGGYIETPEQTASRMYETKVRKKAEEMGIPESEIPPPGESAAGLMPDPLREIRIPIRDSQFGKFNEYVSTCQVFFKCNGIGETAWKTFEWAAKKIEEEDW